jgi:drug/metabolite transporter (DMT)-like permease
MQANKNIQTQDWIVFFALSIVWGFSFFFIKKGLEAFRPLQVAAFRMCFAFMAFIPFIILYRKKLSIDKKKIKYVPLLGLFGNMLPAVCFCLAETKVNSAIVGIQNATTPIFALFMGSLFFKIPLSKNKIAGVTLGFVGACLIVLAETNGVRQSFSYHVFLPLAATFFYGINANLFKTFFQNEHPLVIALWQYGFVFLICFPYLIFSNTLDTIQLNPAIAFNSLFYLFILGVLGTAIAQIYFNRLTQRTSALFAVMTTFIIPVVSVLIGFAIGEKITPLHLAGLLIIFSGIYGAVKG